VRAGRGRGDPRLMRDGDCVDDEEGGWLTTRCDAMCDGDSRGEIEREIWEALL